MGTCHLVRMRKPRARTATQLNAAVGVTDMSIQDLGSIGEFVASVGVVISLVYLAVQTRSNTKAIKAQTRSSITDQVLSIQLNMFNNDLYQTAFQKYLQKEALDLAEQAILEREALLFFKHMENAQFQFDSGLYDVDEYNAQKAIWVKRFSRHSFWRDSWDFHKDTMSPRLVSEVQPIVDGAKAAEITNDA